MSLIPLSETVSLAKICCDSDVGALGINLIGVIEEREINFSGVILPRRPSDLQEVLHKLLKNAFKASSRELIDASLIYRSKNSFSTIGNELVYEDKKVLNGIVRKIYLANSHILIGYIFYKIRGHLPKIVGYAGSVKGSSKNKRFNDDAVIVLGANYCYGNTERSIYIAAVADGVSSLGSGYRASSLAIEKFVSRVLSLAYTEHNLDSSDIYESYITTAEEINRMNHTQSFKSATTLTAIVYPVKGLLYLVHVGDTRAYLFKEGELIQLTEDHKIPGTNMITRALGSGRYEPQTRSMYFEAGSTLLLASDGLYEVVGARGIIRVLTKFNNTTIIVKKLLKKVVKKRGKDDASVGIMRRII